MKIRIKISIFIIQLLATIGVLWLIVGKWCGINDIKLIAYISLIAVMFSHIITNLKNEQQ